MGRSGRNVSETMESIKVSFITTVFNEEDSIGPFLYSLANQSRRPDEIIIVDAFSTDKTEELIQAFIRTQTGRTTIVFLKKRGNRAVGRNSAVSRASFPIIACSDVGCIPDKDWLKKIVHPFSQKNIDVVAGYYVPVAESVFERCLATYTCVMPDKLDPYSYLPSSRSVAFRKQAWEKAGGYPEYLDTCEDLVFAKTLKDNGCRFYVEKDALVFWPQRKKLSSAAWQFYNYAVGDGRARYFRWQTPLLFARYSLAILLFGLAVIVQSQFILLIVAAVVFLYLVLSVLKNYRYIHDLRAIFWLPVLQLTADFCVLAGTSIGYFQRFIRK